MTPPTRPNTPIPDFVPITRDIEWEQAIIGSHIANGWQQQDGDQNSLVFTIVSPTGHKWRNKYDRTTKQLAAAEIVDRIAKSWLDGDWGD